MTIIAERGLFVRLLVQSGRFEQSQAEALADTLDATTREPTTKADLGELRAEVAAGDAALRAELAQLRTEMRNGDAMLAQQMSAQTDRLLVRLGGLMIALIGMLFAALRLT
jgi:tRNA U34 5-carboxymethylaminomethyl modifying GTPase MnmE/TrmE